MTLLPPGKPRDPRSVWHSLNAGTPAPVESVFHGPADLHSVRKWPEVILHRYIWRFLFFLLVYFLFYWGTSDKSCTYLRCARGWFDTHCKMITAHSHTKEHICHLTRVPFWMEWERYPWTNTSPFPSAPQSRITSLFSLSTSLTFLGSTCK